MFLLIFITKEDINEHPDMFSVVYHKDDLSDETALEAENDAATADTVSCEQL